ncbi:MAG: hypothetical protein Kow0069_26890 [Promethearchaeota archaeon]
MKNVFLSPSDFFDDVVEIAKKVKSSGEKYDAIVTILHGGVFLARLLADFLQVNVVVFIDVTGEAIDVSGEEDLCVRLDLSGRYLRSIKGKRVLLVDDIINSGDSMMVAVDLLEPHCSSVHTLALYKREICKFQPNYHLREVKGSTWVIFPYEVVEAVKYYRARGESDEEIKAKRVPAEYFDKVRPFLEW